MKLWFHTYAFNFCNTIIRVLILIFVFVFVVFFNILRNVLHKNNPCVNTFCEIRSEPSLKWQLVILYNSVLTWTLIEAIMFVFYHQMIKAIVSTISQGILL